MMMTKMMRPLYLVVWTKSVINRIEQVLTRLVNVLVTEDVSPRNREFIGKFAHNVVW